MKKRRQQQREERRKAGIEVNLLAETEGGRVITRTRSGCAIPFLSAGLFLIVLFLIFLEALHLGLG